MSPRQKHLNSGRHKPGLCQCYGRVFSEETRQRIGEASRGRRHTEKTRRQMSESRRGLRQTDSARRKISIARRGCTVPDAVRKKIGDAHRGQRHTEETKRKIQEAALRHVVEASGCSCGVCMPLASKLSQRMIEMFLAEFPEIVAEKQFGRYRVDAYLPPPYHLAFEADGDYWHGLPGRKEHDARRDTYLLEQFGLPVVRLTQEDIDLGTRTPIRRVTEEPARKSNPFVLPIESPRQPVPICDPRVVPDRVPVIEPVKVTA